MPLQRLVRGFYQKIDSELGLYELTIRICRLVLFMAPVPDDTLQVRQFRFGCVQCDIGTDPGCAFGVIFVDHPGPRPNCPVTISREPLFRGTNEMETADHPFDMGMLDFCSFGRPPIPAG